MNDEAKACVALIVVGALLVVVLSLGKTRTDQLVERRREVCVLCPDKEEPRCERDGWKLEYVLEHCYEKEQK